MSTPPVVVLSTTHNARKWAIRCLRSVLAQDYPVRHIYIADGSTDGTYELVQNFLSAPDGTSARAIRPKGTTVELRDGVGNPVANRYYAIHELSPETIVIEVDGDDWLATAGAVSRVVREYERPSSEGPEVWLTFGQYRFFPQGQHGFASPYPPDVVAAGAFRRDAWRASHLKTYRAGLFQQIAMQDLRRPLVGRCSKGGGLETSGGDWVDRTYDQLIMLPLLEMAGERHAFIPDVLYEYNTAHPSCDMHNETVRAEGARECARIRAMAPYARLESRPW